MRAVKERGKSKREHPSQGKRRGPSWDSSTVRALRRHLGLSQEGLARELGSRQQTVSEWETGLYRPRGTSSRLLSIIAERAGFEYGAKGQGSGVKEK